MVLDLSIPDLCAPLYLLLYHDFRQKMFPRVVVTARCPKAVVLLLFSCMLLLLFQSYLSYLFNSGFVIYIIYV